MKICELSFLAKGMPGLSSVAGAFLAEAGSVCLESQGHSSGVSLDVRTEVSEPLGVRWIPVTDQQRRAHNDLQDATEHGAYGISILVIKETVGQIVVERSKKGTGFDYWLGEDDDLLFQRKSRLEVSGILRGDELKIAARVRQKLDQTKPTDRGGLPAYIAVVEFGKPCAQVARK